jgi:hypothetical protein
LAFLAAQCKERRVSLRWDAVKVAYADILGEHVPNPVGRPRAGAVHVERRRRGIFVHRDCLQWIDDVTRKHGLFHAEEPVPHAIESGLRLLKAADAPGPVRSARFPFDGAALWQRYMTAAKSL